MILSNVVIIRASATELARRPSRRCLGFSAALVAAASRQSVMFSPKALLSTATDTASPRTILSGIQPTGTPHLGNYLGALRSWVDMQASASSPSSSTPRVLYSVVDLHAITVPQDPAVLRDGVIDMAIALLACGIDPQGRGSILFRQSQVPQHTELAWIFFCRTPIGWLSRMHQWRSKLAAMQIDQKHESVGAATMSLINGTAKNLSEGAEDGTASSEEDATGAAALNLGLLAYPVLQSADILVYKATDVPIGDDQQQHINLTTMTARSFNSHYNTSLFPLPRGILSGPHSKRIMSLRDPTSKMSKSDPARATATILLDDDPDVIKRKIAKATVDSTVGITYDPITRPGVANLLRIYSSFHPSAANRDTITPCTVAEEFANAGNKKFKDAVASVVIEGLRDIRENMARLRKEKNYVEALLVDGERRAREIAEETMVDVRKTIGLQ